PGSEMPMRVPAESAEARFGSPRPPTGRSLGNVLPVAIDSPFHRVESSVVVVAATAVADDGSSSAALRGGNSADAAVPGRSVVPRGVASVVARAARTVMGTNDLAAGLDASRRSPTERRPGNASEIHAIDRNPSGRISEPPSVSGSRGNPWRGSPFG